MPSSSASRDDPPPPLSTPKHDAPLPEAVLLRVDDAAASSFRVEEPSPDPPPPSPLGLSRRWWWEWESRQGWSPAFAAAVGDVDPEHDGGALGEAGHARPLPFSLVAAAAAAALSMRSLCVAVASELSFSSWCQDNKKFSEVYIELQPKLQTLCRTLHKTWCGRRAVRVDPRAVHVDNCAHGQ